MGYSTNFYGKFTLDKPLTVKLKAELLKFSEERHEGYDTMPGYWCNWAPTKDGCGIEWNGAEKFYNYVEWLEYIIEEYLEPNDYVLNGTVEYQGKEHHDRGVVIVTKNKIEKKKVKSLTFV